MVHVYKNAVSLGTQANTGHTLHHKCSHFFSCSVDGGSDMFITVSADQIV